MVHGCRRKIYWLAALTWFFANSASPQENAELAARIDSLQGRIESAAEAGHNAWMLTACALVLFMTAPGLAMFYSGLVRRKNVLGVMMQCLFLMGLMTIVWALWGYSWAFGGSNPYLGNADYLLMQGVGRYWDAGANDVRTPMAGAIPRLTHMLFQGMFFIITPALICGAFAERLKFTTLVVLMVVWGTLVYCPLCHWVWGGGMLTFGASQTFMDLGGSLDFAGGTVVHISSGVSALICALVVGRRLGYGNEPMPPHNLTYSALGAAMLWVGWFGFNAGSQLASDGLASSAFAATHFAAAAGAVAWAVVEWVQRGKPSVLGTSSGAVAGLVCITPAAGYVNPMPALVMGAVGAIGCYYACTGLKSRLRYDDTLDVFGIHGVGGTIGALLTGVFATRQVADALLVSKGDPLGLIDGNPRLILTQFAAVTWTWIWAALATLIILKVLDAFLGLRVSQDQEVQGLDLSQHGEEGYIWL